MRTLVTVRALVARINRKLAKGQEVLRKCRGDSRFIHDLGDYYVVDVKRNVVVDRDVELETYARALLVLRQSEKVAS